AAFTITADVELVGRTADALLKFADRAADEPALAGMRARAFAQLSEAASHSGNSSEGRRLVEEARRAAPEVDDEVVAHIERSAGLAELTALRTAPARTHLSRSVAFAQRAADPWYATGALGRLALATAYGGDLRTATKVLDEAFEFGHALRMWSEMALIQAIAAGVRLLQHDVDTSLSAAEDAIRYFERSGYQVAAGLAFPALAAAYAELGDIEAAEDALRRWRATLPGGQTVFEMALCAK